MLMNLITIIFNILSLLGIIPNIIFRHNILEATSNLLMASSFLTFINDY